MIKNFKELENILFSFESNDSDLEKHFEFVICDEVNHFDDKISKKYLKVKIKSLSNEADYVVIDTAPISLVSDAEELASMVDTSVIVVRQHLVEAREINDTIDALGGRDHLIGCVLNNARKDSMGTTSSRYGYGYGGHYAG